MKPFATRRQSPRGVHPGTSVSGQRRHRPDYVIVMCMGLLMLIGLVVMYAIGPQRANVMNAAYNKFVDRKSVV